MTAKKIHEREIAMAEQAYKARGEFKKINTESIDVDVDADGKDSRRISGDVHITPEVNDHYEEQYNAN